MKPTFIPQLCTVDATGAFTSKSATFPYPVGCYANSGRGARKGFLAWNSINQQQRNLVLRYAPSHYGPREPKAQTRLTSSSSALITLSCSGSSSIPKGSLSRCDGSVAISKGFA